MMRRVVDTNVAIVANGRNTHASIGCRLHAINFLRDLSSRGVIILDLGGEIQGEYRRYLNPSGQPGVGDRFFLAILNSAPSRIERVELHKDPLTDEFLDFPSDPKLATFDKADRKFVAAASKGRAVVATALDAGWLNHKAALDANSIAVQFVCGCDPRKW